MSKDVPPSTRSWVAHVIVESAVAVELNAQVSARRAWLLLEKMTAVRKNTAAAPQVTRCAVVKGFVAGTGGVGFTGVLA